ncbi:MAG: biotin--[acetyl-CoA-carboxylase] ligase [Anaerolineae bacterium]|nr:biotin--[acetyl-CoA-carboxylase] ligase [Anaerolineae bacterium]
MSTSELTQIYDLLTTTWLGRSARILASVGSTMDVARAWAEQGAPAGAMVLADEQTAGKGRLARSWWAPAGTGLLLTLVLRPRLVPRQAQRLTMICSLAVCDAIGSVGDLCPRVKWPNDVLIGGRKVCGILTELGLTGDQLDYALVGIGVNVNLDLGQAPPLMAPATSLSAETGRRVSRVDLLAALLGGLERRHDALEAGHSFHAEWARRLATIGQRVCVTSGTDQWLGDAIGVDEDGALLLRTEGAVQRVLAGDVTLRTPEEAGAMAGGQ